MKRLIVIVVLCMIPAAVFSHPGKTDRYGGHKCLKGCEDWGLYYQEYHLHDKDGRPIRVSKKVKETPAHSESRRAATATAVPIPPVSFQTQTVTLNRYVTNVYEENVFLSNPFLYILLILLLLLLVLRMNRKREER
jgi:H+/gluconate symporter-like permease